MSSRTGRLIIVDDNDMNRDMLARRLQRLGYEVSLADSARELHQRVQDEHIDLVLLDIEMPEISGLDALKTLRCCAWLDGKLISQKGKYQIR